MSSFSRHTQDALSKFYIVARMVPSAGEGALVLKWRAWWESNPHLQAVFFDMHNTI